jgi:hypothetical protein
MLFIQQQIQSFIHLGACKEYSTMARAKKPTKINGSEQALPAVGNSPEPQNGAASTAATSVSLVAAEGRRAAMKNATVRKNRKPELVQTDARATLIPVNLDEEIRQLAYLLSERRGFEPGHETEDWLDAEREVRQRYHQPGA